MGLFNNNNNRSANAPGITNHSATTAPTATTTTASRKFNPALLTQNYFFLTTVPISIIAWFTAFVSQSIAQSKRYYNGQTYATDRSLVGVGWAVIWLELFYIAFLIATVLTDDISASRLILSTFGAVGITLCIIVTDRFIYSSVSSFQAIAAGYLILAIINILWTLYFASDEHSLLRDLFDKLATPAGLGSRAQPVGTALAAPVAYNGHSNNLNNVNNNAYNQSTYGNPQASSIINDYSRDVKPSDVPLAETSQYNNANTTMGSNVGTSVVDPNITAASAVGSNTSNPMSVMNVNSAALSEAVGKAKALYAYTRNPKAEPHEIGFEKGEILDILDSTSRWWVARRQDGQVGTIPSNYVEMLE